MNRPHPNHLIGNERGAVMVESIVAIPTLLTFFAMILQFSYLSMASLVVQHAAVVAARSASVIVPDDPTAFKDNSAVGALDGDRLAAVTDAASELLGALVPLPLQGPVNSTMTVTLKDVKLEGASGEEAEANDLIEATVKYNFACGVMFGGSLICGLGANPTMTLQSVAVMPNQGAEYGYF